MLICYYKGKRKSTKTSDSQLVAMDDIECVQSVFESSVEATMTATRSKRNAPAKKVVVAKDEIFEKKGIQKKFNIFH